MLTILIGRAKTGKSDTMLRRMAELGESSQQILLVPEHASHQAVPGPGAHGVPGCGGAELPQTGRAGAEHHRRHRGRDAG